VAAARRDLRSAELDRLDRRASRDVALRERLAIARVFAEQAALDEEETVDAQRMVISSGDLPEELEDLDASTDRRGLLRVAAAIAVLAAVITLVALALR
jgi:negative regulator of sigma E activity